MMNLNHRIWRPWRLGLLLLVILSGNASMVFCQENPFIFRHISIEDGLAGNDVRSITQDRKGFMWFATDNGLQKYDGYAFTSYHHNPADSLTISSDNLYSLVLDKQNNIWMISFLAGINRLDPIANKSVTISSLIKNSFKEFFLTKLLRADGLGNIWLFNATGIACYNTATNQLTLLKNIFPPEFKPSIYDAKFDPVKNQIWMADRNDGICMYDLNKQISFNRDNNPDHVPVFDLPCQPIQIYLDREKNLWISNFEGDLMRYNIDSQKTSAYQFVPSLNNMVPTKVSPKPAHNASVDIGSIIEDEHGNIWLAGGHRGLFEYVVQKDSFALIPPDYNHSNGLHLTDVINCLYEDKEGNIWVGTDKGVNFFNPSRQAFHFFENDPENKLEDRKKETMDFLQTDQGDLWVASWGAGIAVFDPNLKIKNHFLHHQDPSLSIEEPGNRVWDFLKDKDGRIWMGCQHAYLSSFDPRTKIWRNYHPDELYKNTIMNMRADNNSTIWLALYSGIGKWDTQTHQAVYYNEFIPYEGVSTSTASDILPDQTGNIWVGTLGLGLQKFEKSANRFTRIFIPEKNNKYSISSAVINCMIPINDSMIAIGTGSGGVDLFNMHTNQFYSINAADGLPSNNIGALYFIAPNNLWASAGNMLCRINLQSRKVTRFGSQDGLKDVDLSSCRHFYRLKDGRMLAGYAGGFLYFNPDSIMAGAPPSDVTLTGLNIFDQSFVIDSILQHSDSIILSYKQNFINIQFASLGYLEANRINYYYQLEGIDQNWVNARGQRFATYTNLPAGSYRFKVKCENSEAVFCKGTTFLFIHINPPYWRTWWFELLLVLLGAGALYALYRYRINQLLRLQTVRNEISKDLHDDVGSTLSSISILSEEAKYKMKAGQQEQSVSIMSKINSYAQEMVEKMGDIVWAVNADHDSIQEIIPRLKNFFIETCTSKGIRLQFHPDPGFDKKILPMQARKNIYLICKEAINNAVKYSGCHEITVRFKMVPGGMEISIADDGKGFDPSLNAHGNGLGNMQARATEMKGSLVVYSGQGSSTITLRIPVPKIR
jgi:ligand-binding sensor domain-containing protein